jgi:hypothetical protein
MKSMAAMVQAFTDIMAMTGHDHGRRRAARRRYR